MCKSGRARENRRSYAVICWSDWCSSQNRSWKQTSSGKLSSSMNRYFSRKSEHLTFNRYKKGIWINLCLTWNDPGIYVHSCLKIMSKRACMNWDEWQLFNDYKESLQADTTVNKEYHSLILLYFVNKNSSKHSHSRCYVVFHSWMNLHLNELNESSESMIQSPIQKDCHLNELNESSESMIQSPIHKDSHLNKLNKFMNQWFNHPFKRTVIWTKWTNLVNQWFDHPFTRTVVWTNWTNLWINDSITHSQGLSFERIEWI